MRMHRHFRHAMHKLYYCVAFHINWVGLFFCLRCPFSVRGTRAAARDETATVKRLSRLLISRVAEVLQVTVWILS